MSLLTNLVAYYQLDEASGNELDASGAGLHFTDHSAGAAAGALGGCRTFDGATQYAGRAGNLWQGLAALSVSLWFKSAAASNGFLADVLVSSYDNGVGDGIGVDFDGGTSAKVRLRKAISYANAYAVADAALAVGAWTHVVGTVTAGGLMTLYVNGVAQATTATLSGATAATAGTFLGCREGTTAFYKGSLDELGLWSRDLSAAEVSQLYGAGTPPAFSSFGGGGGAVGADPAALRPRRKARNRTLLRM